MPRPSHLLLIAIAAAAFGRAIIQRAGQRPAQRFRQQHANPVALCKDPLHAQSFLFPAAPLG